MSGREEERRILEALFTRIAALDADGVADLFAEDGRQTMPFAPPGFPSEFVGRETLRANYRLLLGGYGSVAFPDLQIEPLVTDGRWTATYRTDIAFKDGRRYRNRYIAEFRVGGERIFEWREYFDPLILTRELGNPFADGAHAVGTSLIVDFQAKAGRSEELQLALRTLVEASRADRGCVRYELYSVQGEGSHVLVEEWATVEAWEIHMQAGHVTAFDMASRDLVERSSLRRLARLA